MASATFQATGVIPACLLPFKEDLSIDEPEFRRHLRHLAKTRGVTAICVNGHSCEVHTLTPGERTRLIDIAVDEVGAAMPIISGIYANGSLEAADQAKAAQEHGAAALLVFPSYSTIKGGPLPQGQEMAKTHVRYVAEASDLPLVLFQYAYSTGQSYEFDTLVELCEDIPTVVGIKDGIGEPMRHGRHIHDLHSLARPVNVLSTHSTWLLGSLSMGCDGLLSGAGSVIADLQAAMFDAVKNHDLAKAQALNTRMYPITQQFYAAPYLDMHNRMKEVLAHIGRLERAVVRPPQCAIRPEEKAALFAMADEAGLTAEGMKGLDW